MKKILVTGGCGFIGSNYIHQVFEKGRDIHLVNLDKMTYAGNIHNLNGIPDTFHTFVEGDICDADLVKSLFKKYQFDAVVHFAAESHVDRSIEGPAEFIQTNVVGTLNLLEQSRLFYQHSNSDNFRFLHISTDEVYGSLGEHGKFQETTPYDPSSPYSASKAGSDHLVRAWNRTFGLPILITNCSNNYGSYQFPEKLIPLMIINCLHGKPLPVYGKGENVRDWLYVRDHCEAIHSVLTTGTVGETYNIGGRNEKNNLYIADKICTILDQMKPKKMGSYKEQITFVKDRPGHDLRYAIDASKIENELGWKADENFDTGIVKTIEWYIDQYTN